MDYQKLNKKALTCMYIKTGIWSIFIIVILLVANYIFKEDWPVFVSIIVYVLAGLRVVYSLVVPKIRYERYRYILTEEEFEVREGLFFVTTEIVPIERLHKIEVSCGPMFRAFGLKSVKATTAGGEIEVSYIEDAVADQIAEHLKKRINTIVVEERNAEQSGGKSVVAEQKHDDGKTYMEDSDGAE